MNRTNPIGIFDSGIGGLTVVKRISSNFPNENIIYFGDTARVPYGNKSNDTVKEYALQDANFLFKKNVKLIIAACNTVSSVAMDVLKEKFQIPVIGMIEPGARLAVESTENKRIGVIGTYSTIGNKAYSTEIRKLNSKIKVFEKPCPLFVHLAEEGFIDHPATKLIAEEYLGDFKKWKVDTLILGCTHYPLLSGVIQEVVGDKVTLIDSGTAAASVVEDHLTGRGLRNTSVQQGQYEYFLSDISGKFKEVAERFLGRSVGAIRKVDLELLVNGH